MPIKSVKMNISKNKKMQNVPGQGSFNPINRFLGKMVCFVAREHTDRQIHRLTYTDTEDTLSGFQDVFLQFIIKDRSNIENPSQKIISLSPRICFRGRVS